MMDERFENNPLRPNIYKQRTETIQKRRNEEMRRQTLLAGRRAFVPFIPHSCNRMLNSTRPTSQRRGTPACERILRGKNIGSDSNRSPTSTLPPAQASKHFTVAVVYSGSVVGKKYLMRKTCENSEEEMQQNSSKALTPIPTPTLRNLGPSISLRDLFFHGKSSGKKTMLE